MIFSQQERTLLQTKYSVLRPEVKRLCSLCCSGWRGGGSGVCEGGGSTAGREWAPAPHGPVRRDGAREGPAARGTARTGVFRQHYPQQSLQCWEGRCVLHLHSPRWAPLPTRCSALSYMFRSLLLGPKMGTVPTVRVAVTLHKSVLVFSPIWGSWPDFSFCQDIYGLGMVNVT
jgi:hypothetical protein